MAVKKREPVEKLEPMQTIGITDEDLKIDPFPEDAPVKQEARSRDILKRFYAINEPEPTVDKAKLDRLERMGRINTMGKAASLISDAFSLGIGGNVNRKQPDQTAPALFTAYQNTLDKYKDKKDAYDTRRYADERQKLIFALQRLDRESDQQYRDRVQKAREEYNNNRLDFDAAKYANDFALKEADLNRKIEADKNSNRNSQVRNSIAAERVKQAGEKTKSFSEFKVGESIIPVSEGEFNQLYREAVDAAGKGEFKNFKAEMGDYENNPLLGQKVIIQDYLNYKAALEAAKKQSTNYFDKLTRPEYVIPGSGNQAKPTQPTKKIKLEKGSLDNL